MAFIDKSYLDRNYNSKNPLRRFAHRTRFKKSIQSIESNSEYSLMDFGCGDGTFMNQLNLRSSSVKLVGFEPIMDSIEGNQIEIYKNWEDIISKSKTIEGFDYVTCFEVLEHFSPENQLEALKKMNSVLKKDGKVIISVPIEKGFPALVKNLIRRVNLPQSVHIFSYKNIWNSFLSRSLLHLRQDPGYMSHMGFYFTDLEDEIGKLFKQEKKSFSPFGGPSHHFNSQVFFTLTKK